jgi:hypothetical protein
MLNNIILESIILLFCLILYLSLYSVFITGSSYDPDSVSYTELSLGVFGFIIGMWISSFFRKTIFDDEIKNKNIYIILIIGIVSTIVMSCAIIANIYNVKGIRNFKWVQYNQILFPLYGGLILISENSFKYISQYILYEINNNFSDYSSSDLTT